MGDRGFGADDYNNTFPRLRLFCGLLSVNTLVLLVLRPPPCSVFFLFSLNCRPFPDSVATCRGSSGIANKRQPFPAVNA